MTRNLAVFAAKSVILWVAVLIASIIAAQIIAMGDDGVGTDGPLSGPQAFLIVNYIHAAVLATVADRSTLRGWRLALLVWTTLFFAQSFLLMMEAAYFRDSLQISTNLLIEGCLHVLISGAMIGGVAAALWRALPGRALSVPDVRTAPVRLAMIAGLYVVCYLIAGYYIAWQVSELREYYGFGEDIAFMPLVLFQVLRGAMWGLLAWFLAANMSGGVNLRAVVVGMAFSVLATAQLLYPSTIMPWEIRFPHLVEVGISNFVFGALATRLLFVPLPWRRAEAAREGS